MHETPPEPLLEVAVRHERDVAGALEGGADRLLLAGDGGLSPEPATVTAVCRAADELPVRVVLRLNDGWTTTGGEAARLVGLGTEYVDRGAEGLALGFLDPDLEVDLDVCAHLLARLPAVPWTFHRAVDATLDMRRSLRRLVGLPRLSAIWSAGSPRGLGAGFEDLLDAARADEAVAALLMPGGDLRAEQVPWLLRAGVRQFHLGDEARPGRSARAYVDGGLVRSLRLLLDDLGARVR
ncbi:copper homeostasis protein CutC [Nocardioides sp. CFH 31398]|uniref:copper homeostasis protein CutC n=1 Tax=Nocardioides sp. CFH 31398 TaxID=2919579 RepID=UPI001F05C9A4|nr:copper homeostasis protein CutC [Nocardioides sp. CFH 31398]MCH1867705.1 copper homeostasis protein CutC [Nocardioides sp. CFH 31398]